MSTDDELLNLKNEALSLINETQNLEDLEKYRIDYLGRKGKLNIIIKRIPHLNSQERILAGKTANEVKNILEDAISFKEKRLNQDSIGSQKEDGVDITGPGIKPGQGHLHLVTEAIEEISSILEKIGFVRMRYPEVDWEWYAFESLNIPKDHPARDDFETFYLEGEPSPNLGRICLTPHTSNGQVREMQNKTPPIRMTNIGKCYRPNFDMSHTPMFHQFEGLVIDKQISIANLKGTLDYFAGQYFGLKRKTRLRPFHFQFTEPSFEVDITCGIREGRGYRLSKEGWLKQGGAGMVHPKVLINGGVNPKIYSGFAFGWGVERVLMMRANLNIPDMRILYQNDLRFLNQF